jgi:hypothetical protein
MSGSSSAKSDEIDRNFAKFMEVLPSLVRSSAGKWALMRHGSVIRLCDTAMEAQIAGNNTYPDRIFSIQPVREEAEELGYFSYAVDKRVP